MILYMGTGTGTKQSYLLESSGMVWMKPTAHEEPPQEPVRERHPPFPLEVLVDEALQRPVLGVLHVYPPAHVAVAPAPAHAHAPARGRERRHGVVGDVDDVYDVRASSESLRAGEDLLLSSVSMD